MRIITGFHAIEESVRSGAGTDTGGKPRLLYGKIGPRIKKILTQAKERGIPAFQSSGNELDALVLALDETVRDHRGIVLVIDGAESAGNAVSFDEFIARCSGKKNEKDADEKKISSLVLLLDSITDPHNIGAILRCCDQFAVDLVITPGHNSAKSGDIVSRSSAGASEWVPQCTVNNLVRAAETLKSCGFWIYGAEAGGKPVSDVRTGGRTALVMGSEGGGISRLLRETCDNLVSIPTMGKLDSLNVSVACGILLYELRRG